MVGLDEFNAAAERLDLISDPFRFVIEPARGDGDIGAGFGENESGGGTDAACAAGYQSDFTRELHQRVATDLSSFASLGIAATPMKPMNISLKDWSPQKTGMLGLGLSGLSEELSKEPVQIIQVPLGMRLGSLRR